MRIIGLFDYYFLILIFIQFLTSNVFDVNTLKRNNQHKEASVLKWITRVTLGVSLAMTVISYLYE